jgi:hypothetical protein
MRGRSNVGPVLVAAVLALLLVCASPAFAGAPLDVPDPAFTVSPSPVTLKLTLGSLFATGSTAGEATGTVLVTRLVPSLSSVSVSAFSSDGHPPESGDSFPVSFGSLESTSTVMSVTWMSKEPATGWLSFSDATNSPVVVPLQFRLETPAAVLGQVCGYSAALAALIMLVSVLWLVFTMDKAPAGTDAGVTKLAVSEGPTWTFQGSWATNLTALGALFGTVLSTSGFLSEVMPGLSLGMFVAFNLLYLFLLPLAAVVYQAFSLKDKPSFPGLVAAGGITLWATLGELATALVLFMRGGMSPWLVGFVLPVAAVVLTLYAVASLRAATQVTPDWIDAQVGATSAAAIVAAHRALQTAGGGGDGDGPNKDSREARRQAELAAAIVVAAADATAETIDKLVDEASPEESKTAQAADRAKAADGTDAPAITAPAPRRRAYRVRSSRAPILF